MFPLNKTGMISKLRKLNRLTLNTIAKVFKEGLLKFKNGLLKSQGISKTFHLMN